MHDSSHKTLRRLTGGAIAVAVLFGLVVPFVFAGPRALLAGLIAAISSAWCAPEECPVVASYGTPTGSSLDGAAVYYWKEGELVWAGLAEDGGESGPPEHVLVRLPRHVEGAELEAIVFWERPTVAQMWAILSSNPEVRDALAEFTSVAMDRLSDRLPVLLDRAWQHGLEDLSHRVLDKLARELRKHERELNDSAKRIVRALINSLATPEAEARWEPVVRRNLEPVASQIAEDAIRISFREAAQLGVEVVTAPFREDVNARDSLVRFAVKRVEEAVEQNEGALRDAVERTAEQLLDDPELREGVRTRIAPVVEEEFARLRGVVLKAVRSTFEDPQLLVDVAAILDQPAVRRELTALADDLRADAEAALGRAALAEDGTLRGEVAFLIRVSTLADSLPCVVLREQGSDAAGRRTDVLRAHGFRPGVDATFSELGIGDGGAG